MKGKLLLTFGRHIVIAADGIESGFLTVLSSPGAREGRCPPQLEPAHSMSVMCCFLVLPLLPAHTGNKGSLVQQL